MDNNSINIIEKEPIPVKEIVRTTFSTLVQPAISAQIKAYAALTPGLYVIDLVEEALIDLLKKKGVEIENTKIIDTTKK